MVLESLIWNGELKLGLKNVYCQSGFEIVWNSFES